jgi:hypothetical protein
VTTDLAEVHTPGARDLAGWPRCSACGYRYPCPDLRDALPEQTADEMEVVALVDVGWSVWTARAGGRTGWLDNDDDGGTVVGWWDDPGDDTQPARRIFRCLDFPHGRHRFAQIAAGDIDAAACSLPNASTLRSHARRLAREFSQHKGVVSQYDLALLETALTLLRVVA